MSKLGTRLDRLEGKRGAIAPAPSVVFLCAGETGDPLVAMRMGGGHLIREDGESAEAFTARAMGGTSVAIHLPDNGRDTPNG